MANSVNAQGAGYSYQADVFWREAARLFVPESQVVRVDYEADGMSGFDDVVVHYAEGHTDEGMQPVVADAYQVKFHVDQRHAITSRDLIDPTFIGGTAHSLLARLRNLHRALGQAAEAHRFHLLTPWAVDSRDSLGFLVENSDGRLRLDVLFKGKTDRGKIGRIRREWREHLGLDTDQELCTLLRSLRIRAGHPDAGELRSIRDAELQNAGFRRPMAGSAAEPYEGLIRRLCREGVRKFTRELLQAAAEKEGLWLGNRSSPREKLARAVLQPQSVFKRTQVDHFTGREWLAAGVEAFIQGQSNGYVVIEAGAGLGKTAFLASWARRRDCIQHFVELAPGPEGIVPALRSLAAQVVLKWIPESTASELLADDPLRPDFLESLLVQAASARDRSRPGEPIVIVVDGLDEAGIPHGANVLALPRTLPPGVFFLVSQRPVDVPLRTDAPRHVLRIDASEERNLTDMRLYLESAARRDSIRTALEAGGCTPGEFVETLLQKSGGVWVFSHYILAEIEAGERTPLSLAALPQGIWGYYAEHWRRWQERAGADWKHHLRLLTTLAAVQEDVTAGMLGELTGVPSHVPVTTLLEQSWRAFLVWSPGDERGYRLYHASLREFLDGRASLGAVTEGEKALSRQMASATRTAHARIADYFLERWGGLERGLPALHEAAPQTRAERYGIRHLFAHLEQAGRIQELHQILTLRMEVDEGARDSTTPPPEPVRFARLWKRGEAASTRRSSWMVYHNLWYVVFHRMGDLPGFLSNLDRAWRLSEPDLSETVQRVGGSQAAVDLELGIRYALTKASINSLADAIPPALLPHLVQQEIWNPVHALAYARQIPDAERRSDALSRLLPYLPEDLKDEAWPAAMQAISRIPYIASTPKKDFIARLAPKMPPEFLENIVTDLLFYSNLNPTALLTEIGPYVSPALLEKAVQESPREYRAEIVGAIAGFLPDALRAEAVAHAWAAVQDLDLNLRHVLLAQQAGEPGAVRRAFEAVDWQNDWFDLDLLKVILPTIPEELQTAAVARMVDALHIPADYMTFQRRLDVLATFPPSAFRARHEVLLRLAADVLRRKALRSLEIDCQQVLSLLTSAGLANEGLALYPLQKWYSRADELAVLAPELSESGVRACLRLLDQSDRVWYREDTRRALLLRLARLGHPEEALHRSGSVQSADFLATLTSLLPEPLRQQAVKSALRTTYLREGIDTVSDAVDAALWSEAAECGANRDAVRNAPASAVNRGGFYLDRVVAVIPPALREETLRDALSQPKLYRPVRAQLLAHLMPFLRGWDRMKALREVRSCLRAYDIEVTAGVARTLTAHLPEWRRVGVFRELLSWRLEYGRDTEAALPQMVSSVTPYVARRLLRQMIWRRDVGDLVSSVMPYVTRRRLRRRRWRRGVTDLVQAFAPLLSLDMLVREFKSARRKRQMKTMCVVGSALAARGAVDVVRQTAAKMKERSRITLLAAVARYLPPDVVRQAFDDAAGAFFTHEREYLSVQVSLAEALEPSSRTVVSEQALKCALAVHDLWTIDLDATARLLPLLAPDGRERLLRHALLLAAAATEDDCHPKHFELLVPHLLACDHGLLMELWRKFLHQRSSGSRKVLLAALAAFAPVIRTLGGCAGVTRARAVVKDVRTCWNGSATID
jgi:hypothetical protein